MLCFSRFTIGPVEYTEVLAVKNIPACSKKTVLECGTFVCIANDDLLRDLL